MFIRLNFAVLLEETREGHSPSLWAPRAGLALYLPSYTYYMLITAILKPRLQGVNLVGHYASLYFRVLCVEPLWGFGERCESEDEKLEERGEECFISHKGEENRGGKSSYRLYYLSEWNERAGTGTLGQTLSNRRTIVSLKCLWCV